MKAPPPWIGWSRNKNAVLPLPLLLPPVTVRYGYNSRKYRINIIDTLDTLILPLKLNAHCECLTVRALYFVQWVVWNLKQNGVASSDPLRRTSTWFC